jgi:hypothetical protein
MFQAFLIVGREAIELLLIVFALRQWAKEADKGGLDVWIAAGVALGFGTAICVVAALPPSGMNEWVDIALTCGFGLSVALLSCGAMASMGRIGVHTTSALDRFFEHRNARVPVLAFVAFSASREALEAFLLIRFIAASTAAEDVAWGAGLGLGACVLLAVVWRALATNPRTHVIFRLTAVALFVLGIQMLLEAVVESLLRGVAGAQLTHVAYLLLPYVENGDRYWVLCLALASVPFLVWMNAWWKRASN